jgi:hypothetical protein
MMISRTDLDNFVFWLRPWYNYIRIDRLDLWYLHGKHDLLHFKQLDEGDKHTTCRNEPRTRVGHSHARSP